MQWVTDQRVLFARRLLEETDSTSTARRQFGFRHRDAVRHHFRRIIGVTPSDYRRRFSCDESSCVPTVDDHRLTITA